VFNWSVIDRLAKAHHQISEPTEDTVRMWLRMWWCFTYNRPFKDPLLKEYTDDELAYEYLRHSYAKPGNDPAKKEAAEAKRKADEDWIKEQLNKAAEARRAKAEAEKAAPPPPPETSLKFDPKGS
jgi:hypothetical protein